MTTATLTPYDLSDATKVGKRLYRKQVLPLGSITYQGQKITFDKGFLTDLANSFKDGAYDQVPFVLADADNRHHMNPEGFRGEVAGFEVTKDGLDALVSVSKDGAKILEDNPRLGVSARIVQGLQKADGRSFKRAIQHVLGTMDPKVTGLRPWQAVDLSEDDDDVEVVDLTASEYTTEDDVAKPKKPEVEGDVSDIDLSTLTDEEFLEFLDLSTEDHEEENLPVVTDEDVEVQEDDEDDDDDTEGVVEVDADSVEDSDDDTEDEQDESADLSESVLQDDERDEVTALRMDLATERFKSERTALLHAGVPKAMIDLAEPLLRTPDPVVMDLSNADGEDVAVNATQVVRDLLEQSKGYIKIRPEVGHQVDLSESDADKDAALLAQWDAEYGKV